MERTAFLSICATGKTWGLGSAGVLDFLCCFAKVPFVRLQVRDITRYGRVGMQSLITTVVSLHVKWSYRGKFVLLSFNPKWMMPIVLELSGLFQWSAIPQSHYLNSALWILHFFYLVFWCCLSFLIIVKDVFWQWMLKNALLKCL